MATTNEATEAAVMRLGELLATQAIEAWTGRRLAKLSAEEKLAAVRSIEAARGFTGTRELIREGREGAIEPPLDEDDGA